MSVVSPQIFDVTSELSLEPSLSVVIPVYGCAPCLRPLYVRLKEVLERISREYEIIFVDDCSTDGAEAILAQLARENHRIVVRKMDRNSGQFAAIGAGLSVCRGARAVVMDCDLKDPPETIPHLIQSSNEGADIVVTVQSSRNLSLRFVFSRLFRRATALYRRFPNHLRYSAFSLLSRAAIDRYLHYDDLHRGYLVILDRLDLPYAVVEYHAEKRFAGRSSYDWPRLISAAIALYRASRFPGISRHPDRSAP